MDKMKPVAALFDFDGVVMDTETQYSLFWGEQGRKYHPEIPDFDQLIKGSTLDQILDKHFNGQEELQKQIRHNLTIFEGNMAYEYIPGVVDFMKSLKKHGVKIAVVTSSNEEKMKNVYRAQPDFQTLVDKILTAEYFTKSKPDPECFLLGAKVFETIPANCVVFEDSFNGLKAGNAAEMCVVGLATTNSRKAIEDKARLVIDDFSGFTYEHMMQLLN